MPGRKVPEEERRGAILRAAYAVAARERLTGVTARAVAAEAGVSSGLVFFHFESIDGLLVALLDWLLERTIVPGEAMAAAMAGASGEDPGARLVAILAEDIRRLPRQRERVELFFDYWVLGTRHPAIRRKIRGALERFRDAFLPLARAVIESDPERYASVTAEGLADVVASFVHGCSLQIVTTPGRFDVERSLATLEALVRFPASATS